LTGFHLIINLIPDIQQPKGQLLTLLRAKNFYKRIILYITIAACAYVIFIYILSYFQAKSEDAQISSVPGIESPKTIVNSENWEVYGNSAYKYSIKYPLDWIVSLAKEGFKGVDAKVGTSSEVVISGPVSTNPQNILKINILVSKTVSESLDTDFNSTTSGKGIGGQIIVLLKEQTKIGEVDAIRYKADFPSENVNLHFVKDGKRFIISTFYDRNLPESLIIFNEIISTFKFLE